MLACALENCFYTADRTHKKILFLNISHVDWVLFLGVAYCCKEGVTEMGFALNCNSDVLETIGREAKTAGLSRTQYINKLLENAIQMPKPLTSGTSLEELKAHSRLFSDDVLDRIPAIAQKERRSTDQMLLHLVELGIASINRGAERSEATVQLGLVPPLHQ